MASRKKSVQGVEKNGRNRLGEEMGGEDSDSVLFRGLGNLIMLCNEIVVRMAS
jgi:hypothetical protein